MGGKIWTTKADKKERKALQNQKSGEGDGPTTQKKGARPANVAGETRNRREKNAKIYWPVEKKKPGK